MPKRPFRVSTSQLPEPSVLLRGIYAGRLVVATALFIGAASGGATARPLTSGAAGLLLAATAWTALSVWWDRRSPDRPSLTFLFAQIVFDTALLTAIVYATGGAESLFAPLYILVIFAAALLLPVLGGVLIAMLAMVLYFVTVFAVSGALADTAVLQVLLFGIVAIVTGYLADRLRQTGAALGVVETELRQLRLDTGDILSTINSGVLTVDGDGRLAYLNPAAEEMLSLDGHEFAGIEILDRLDELAPGLGRVIARSMRDRVALRRFETEPLAAGAPVLGVSTTVVAREDGGVASATAIFQDITEKKRAEALRRRAERLEAVAELSASLAHEIKNPLASIRSAVEQLGTGSVDPDDGRILTGLVVRESDRLSRLLAEFIDFARVKVTAPEGVDVNSIVEHVVEVVDSHPDSEGRSIEIVEAPDGPVLIRGAEDLLHRAVLNLVLNAVQWAGDGGRVELILDELRSDLLSPTLGARRLLRLTVSDSGPGVPPDLVDHIFDPFFTRRAGGTGLGLALVQRAVEAHGGAIFVDSAPAGGAAFTLYLPALSSPETETIPT